MSNVDAVTVVSNPLKNELEVYFNQTIHVIHNGIDTDLFKPWGTKD